MNDTAGPTDDDLRASAAYPVFYRATVSRWIARTLATEASLDAERLEMLASGDAHNGRPPPSYPADSDPVGTVRRVAVDILATLPPFIGRDLLVMGCLDAAVRMLCVDDPSVIRAYDRLIRTLNDMRVVETNSH